MPIRLRDIIRKSRKLEIQYAEETIEVEYRPHAVTLALLEEMEKRSGNDSVAMQIEAVIARWTITDDDGKEIPPTLENAKMMPLDFLTTILQEIVKDMEAWNKDEKKSSGAGSSTTT